MQKKKILSYSLALALVLSSTSPLVSTSSSSAKGKNTKAYKLSKAGGSYAKGFTLKIKAKKGYKVYYSKNKKKFTLKKIVKPGKKKKIKISKTTKLYLYAVKKNKSVTKKLLKSKKVKKKAKVVNYKITTADTSATDSSATTAPSSGTSTAATTTDSTNAPGTSSVPTAASSANTDSATATNGAASAKPDATAEATATDEASSTEGAVATKAPSATEGAAATEPASSTEGAAATEPASATDADATEEPTAEPTVLPYVDGSSLASMNKNEDGSITITFSEAEDPSATAGSDVTGITATVETYSTEGEERAYTKFDITEAGTYYFTGTAVNSFVNISDVITNDVKIVLSNLTVDNTDTGFTTDTSIPFLSSGGKNHIDITLEGTNTILAGESFTGSPASGVIFQDAKKGSLTLNGGSEDILTIYDPLTSFDSVDYGDEDPTDGIATKGTLTITGGTYNIEVNGDCLKGTNGGITISDGTYNLKSPSGTAIKSKSSNITIDGGTFDIDCKGDDTCAVQAKNGTLAVNGGDLTISSYGDGMKGQIVRITDGIINITTHFINAGLNYYNKSLSTYNTRTVNESGSSKTKVDVINIDTGSHKGIKAGTKAETYVYTSVSDGSDYTAGEEYSTEASGGIYISGGTINIDTTDTGIKFNSSGNQRGGGSGNLSVAADQQVILGAPDDAIKSQNDIEISGGKITIQSADKGIQAANTLTITDAQGTSDQPNTVIKIEQAYEGIEAGTMIVGSSDSDSLSPYVSVKTCDDGINMARKTLRTVYENEDEDVPYTETKVSSMTGNDFTIYSGTVNVMIDDQETHTYSLYVTDGQGVVDDNSYVTGTYTGNGDGIDCNGSAYFNGGTTIVWGPTSGDNSAIDTADNGGAYVISAGATVFAADSGGMTNNPTSLTQNAVSYNLSSSSGMGGFGGMGGMGGFGGNQNSSSSLAANTVFGISDTSGNTCIAGIAPKSIGHILFSSPDLTSNTSYTLSSGGSGSTLVNNYSDIDYRISDYDSSNATTVATATASTTISGGGNQGPGGRF